MIHGCLRVQQRKKEEALRAACIMAHGDGDFKQASSLGYSAAGLLHGEFAELAGSRRVGALAWKVQQLHERRERRGIQEGKPLGVNGLSS